MPPRPDKLASVRRLSDAGKARLQIPPRFGQRFPQLQLQATTDPRFEGNDVASLCPPTVPVRHFTPSSLRALSSASGASGAGVDLAPGDVVEIRESDQRLAGYGVWDPAATTGGGDGDSAVVHAFHYLRRDITAPLNIDAAYWKSRWYEALDSRKRLVPPLTDMLRLLDGARDGVPGLTIDQFGKLLVVTVEGAYALPLAAMFTQLAVQEVGAGVAVYTDLAFPSAQEGSESGLSMTPTASFGRFCSEAGVPLPVSVAEAAFRPALPLRGLRQYLRDLCVSKTVLISGDAGGAIAANAVTGTAASVTVVEPNGPDAVAFCELASENTAKMNGQRRSKVVAGTLADLAPDRGVTLPQSERFDVVVVAGATAPVPGSDGRLMTLATPEQQRRELHAAERLVKSGGMIAVAGPLKWHTGAFPTERARKRSGKRRPSAGAEQQQHQPRQQQQEAAAPAAPQGIVSEAARVAASEGSCASWRLVKQLRVSVDFPASGHWQPDGPFAAIFHVRHS